MVGKKAEDKAVGRTKGGLNTKLHALADGLGNPVAFLLSPGNDSDSAYAIELMSMTDIAGSNLLGDNVYGTKEILASIEEHGATVVIPPKSNAKEHASFRRANGFAALLQGMINLTCLFLLLCIWPLL